MKQLVACACLMVVLLCSAAAPAATNDDTVKFRTIMEEGITLLKTGDREEINRAVARFKSALKLNPESSEAYYWLALAYSDLDMNLRARESARDATTYDDRMAEAWSLLGQLHLYDRNWKDAKEHLETAISLAPDDPIALFNLGRVYYHGFKDPTSALANFRTAWQRCAALRRDNPDYAPLSIRARFYMGLCEYDRGSNGDHNPLYFNNAINAFLDVLKDQPTNYDAALRLALAYRKGGRVPESENLLLQIHKNLSAANPQYFDRQLFAEVNLQLADMYLKEPAVKNLIHAVLYMRQFVDSVGDSSHHALEPAKEFLLPYDQQQGAG